MHQYEVILVDPDGEEVNKVIAHGGHDLVSKMLVAFREGYAIYVDMLPDNKPVHNLQWKLEHSKELMDA